jgi:hypothetical protein
MIIATMREGSHSLMEGRKMAKRIRRGNKRIMVA